MISVNETKQYLEEKKAEIYLLCVESFTAYCVCAAWWNLTLLKLSYQLLWGKERHMKYHTCSVMNGLKRNKKGRKKQISIHHHRHHHRFCRVEIWSCHSFKFSIVIASRHVSRTWRSSDGKLDALFFFHMVLEREKKKITEIQSSFVKI